MCLRLRLELGLDAFGIIIINAVIITIVSLEKTLELYHKMLLGGFSFLILAAIILLLGVILKNLFLLYAWMAILLPGAVLIFIVTVIQMAKEWDRIYFIVGVVYPFLWLYILCYSVKYALRLKRSADHD
ncbi:uncharacterized protein LOC122613372 isoform X1 [Drosophila teissieri]|uniref:uncharacterized protein LOC122613372 isoform X1 n=1 Tax=Drosophila teissieri TaxID=7243 RepID=UPI001CBA1EB0|nr:uncharacterized protein LOC122613372 isoform X1 [Drosophila teissieri]